MTIGELVPLVTILVALFGVAKWIANNASKLTEAIITLNLAVKTLGDNFGSFKEDAKKEHEKTRETLDDHETRIHSLEDWKKYKEGDIK